MQAWGTNWALVSILVLLDFVLKVTASTTPCISKAVSILVLLDFVLKERPHASIVP